MTERIFLAVADLEDFLTDVSDKAGLSTSGGKPNQSIEEIVGNVISVLLGTLGVVFLVLSVYAGFLWATSQGSEEKVKKAQEILRNSIIGLIITLAAYSISYFVIQNVKTATGL
ncbi:MAG: pilin [Patescibacteria group bacterium]|mgnify:CR=1 FL=1